MATRVGVTALGTSIGIKIGSGCRITGFGVIKSFTEDCERTYYLMRVVGAFFRNGAGFVNGVVTMGCSIRGCRSLSCKRYSADGSC